MMGADAESGLTSAQGCPLVSSHSLKLDPSRKRSSQAGGFEAFLNYVKRKFASQITLLAIPVVRQQSGSCSDLTHGANTDVH